LCKIDALIKLQRLDPVPALPEVQVRVCVCGGSVWGGCE